MADFADKLLAMFEEVEPDFRAALIKQYREIADRQLEVWLKSLEGPEPTGRFAWEQRRPPEFVTHDEALAPIWSNYQKFRSVFRADYKKAERTANTSVDNAKLHFISKQSKKLANATKLAKGKPKLTGHLALRVMVVTGSLLVEYKRSKFTLTMSMIVNYRHQRGFKSFYQFPARFANVEIDGIPQIGTRVSEAWMEKNFK